MSAAEFRNQVLAGLRGDLSQFSLDQIARKSGASAEVVANTTKQIFAKYVARLVEDGDYTPAEQSKAASLAEMLKLSAEDVTSIETSAKEQRYRQEQLAAEADGVVTQVEEESLYQMRIGLGLPITPIQSSSAGAPGPTAIERNPSTPSQIAGAQPFVEAKLRSSLRFESLNTARALRFELERLKELDKTAEDQKSFWIICCVATGLLAVGLTMVSIALFRHAGMLLVIPAFLTAATFIFSIVKYLGIARLDVEDRRYLIAQAIIHNLSVDMGEDDLIGLEIDFNTYEKGGELKGTEGGGFMSSEKAMSYALPWLQMKGRFLDGTRFRLGATQCVKRKERSKRKYTKVKEAFSEKLTITLAVKPKLQPHLAQAAAMLKARGRMNGLTFRQVSTDGNVLTVQAMTPRLATIHGRYNVTNENAAVRTCSHHTVLGLLLACYDAIGRAKSGQAA